MVEYREIHDLENFYKTQFKARIGKIPGTTHKDRNALGQLLQERGQKESAMLIETFFKMNKPFFKTCGYTLECFFKNINEVIVESQKVTAPRAPRQKQFIQVSGYCRNVKCTNRFPVTVPTSLEGLDQELCPECSSSNLQLKLE